ncbi:MAG: serS [Fibrobacteria bacterium]|jgi:seryl-tRNA synthetase|nr:serS [Fibrobacteria bacterium]
MLDPKLYRDHPEKVREGLRRRGASFDLDGLLRLDQEKRALGTELDGLKAERNAASESIAQLKRAGKDASEAIEKTRTTGDRIKDLQIRFDVIEERARDLALLCPNLPHASVPDGKSSADNKVAATWGEDLRARAEARVVPDHIEIGMKLKLFDFERGAKISGSGFPIFTGAGARLERALINFFLDTHVKAGFTEVSPPYLVNRASMVGTGQLPKFEEDMYRSDGENRDRDLFLVPTAEVPVTNMHADEILDGASLPVSYCAFTACFRREAGSWGADTRGFLRLHQFDKVEMVRFSAPENSYEQLESLRAQAEKLLQLLELPYRVLELCAGDMGFGAAKCYDLEVWAPAEKKWLEVSSVSNFEDFQARRANIRAKSGGQTRFLHTLNGSGLATPRVLVSFLETHYTERGTVRIPEALRPWMGGLEEIAAA